MKIFFRGVGKCKVSDIVEMPACPRVGDIIDFPIDKGPQDDWSVRTVVWTPKEPHYDAYCVIGDPRP